MTLADREPHDGRGAHRLRVAGGALLCATALLLATTHARAHDRSVSQSSVSVQGTTVSAHVRLRTVDLSALSAEVATWAHDRAAGRDAAAAEALPEALVEALHTHFRVLDQRDAACVPRAPLRLVSEPAELRLRLTFDCGAEPARYVVTPWPVPGHHHLAHVEGGAREGTLIVGETRELSLARAESPEESPGVGAAMLAYLRYGAEHAATGWDHVLFVLLLLAFAPRLRDAAVLVTGFTLGHAITLVLAALAVLESRAVAVESLIAASVVLVAAENVARAEARPWARVGAPLLVALGGLGLGLLSGERALVFFAVFAACVAALGVTAADRDDVRASALPQGDTSGAREAGARRHARTRLALAVAFGLVHGLGFASGFDAEGPLRVPRLVAFNLGVELAQLGWLALGWPLLRWLGSPEAPRRVRVVQAFSVLAGAAATYACVTRVLVGG